MVSGKKIVLFVGFGFLLLVIISIFFIFSIKKQNGEDETLYAVSMECVYKNTKMKSDGNEYEAISNGTGINHILNLYIVLSDVFEEEGLFDKRNRRMFLEQHIDWEDMAVYLKAETGFLLKGKKNLKKFKNIIEKKDFKDVDITKEKFKKALDEVVSFVKRDKKKLTKDLDLIDKVLNSSGENQVNFAKEYYTWEIEKIKQEVEILGVYDKEFKVEELYSKRNIERLEKQNSLTEKQVDEFKTLKSDAEKDLSFIQQCVIGNKLKHVNYENVKDLHRDIASKKIVKYEKINEIDRE